MEAVPADRAVGERCNRQPAVAADIDGPAGAGQRHRPDRLAAIAETAQVPIRAEHKGAAIRRYRETAGRLVFFERQRLVREARGGRISPVAQWQACGIRCDQLTWRCFGGEPPRLRVEPSGIDAALL